MRPMISTTIFVLVVLLAYPIQVAAIQGVVEKQKSSEIAELIDAYMSMLQEENRSIPPGEKGSQQKDQEHEQLKAAVSAYIIKKIDDENARTENTKYVVHWSNISANTTFWIAHLLLIFGLAAATMELRNAWRLRSKGKKDSVEVEISFERIALRSSMYGVLILFVSLLFYFLYLKFVYPVIVL